MAYSGHPGYTVYRQSYICSNDLMIVYCITNSKNGKKLVGFTNTLSVAEVLNSAWKQREQRTSPLSLDMRQLQKTDFTIEALEGVQGSVTLKDAAIYVANHVNSLNTFTPIGYNTHIGVSRKGVRVFKATNTKTGKAFIGFTSQTQAEAWSALTNNEGNRNTPLGLAIAEYGAEAFMFEDLYTQEAREPADQSVARVREFVRQHKTLEPDGYNRAIGKFVKPGGLLIYLATNTKDNKSYVGISHNTISTVRCAWRKVVQDPGQNSPLVVALRRDGENAFTWRSLYETDEHGLRLENEAQAYAFMQELGTIYPKGLNNVISQQASKWRVVYLVTNTVTGMKYVGATRRSLRRRWAGHVADAKSGSKYRLHQDMSRLGLEAFTQEILCTCASDRELKAKEQEYAEALKTFDPEGYNSRAGGKDCDTYIQSQKGKGSGPRVHKPAKTYSFINQSGERVEMKGLSNWYAANKGIMVPSPPTLKKIYDGASGYEEWRGWRKA